MMLSAVGACVRGRSIEGGGFQGESRSASHGCCRRRWKGVGQVVGDVMGFRWLSGLGQVHTRPVMGYF